MSTDPIQNEVPEPAKDCKFCESPEEQAQAIAGAASSEADESQRGR